MRRAAQAAIVGILLYVAIDVALVFLRPGFSVLHNAESDYGSRGAYAWVMDLNFLLRCAASLAVVWALALVVPASGRLRAGLACLAVWAVASGLLAFFPDDPVGTKSHGLAKVHLLLAAIAFVAVIIGTRLSTRALRRDPGWRPVLAPLAVLSWGALVPVLLLSRSHLRPHSLGGLYEKVFLGVELAWFLLCAVWIARREVRGSGRPGARLQHASLPRSVRTP
jgi:hypothetical membrane protein